jgi:MFS family permease
LSSTVIGVILAINLLLVSTLQFFTGRIADRFNRRSLVILGSLANLAYLALIPQAHNLWYLLGLCALGGLGTAIAIPAASAMTVEEGRKLGMGSTMGIFITAFSIGMAVGPLISGVIANVADINSVFYFAAAIALAGPSLFIWFTRRHEVAT